MTARLVVSKPWQRHQAITLVIHDLKKRFSTLSPTSMKMRGTRVSGKNQSYQTKSKLIVLYVRRFLEGSMYSLETVHGLSRPDSPQTRACCAIGPLGPGLHNAFLLSVCFMTSSAICTTLI